ncbi:MAG: ATP-binding protein [Candidatus Poribacteria bacterium]|nr:ATP-binding protein [Candidatus Poribacteria bacterium]
MMIERLRLRMGLRGQLVLLFLLVSLIPLLVVSFLGYRFGVSALEKTIYNNLVQFAEEKLHQADRSIPERLAAIEARLQKMSAMIAETNDSKPPTLARVYLELQDDFNQLKKDACPDGQINQITVTNLNQRVIIATDERLRFEEIHEKWWDRAYNNGFGYKWIGDIEYDIDRQLHYMPIALPIRDETPGSKVVGVLSAVISLPELSELVKPPTKKNEDTQDAEIFLLDEFGRVIACRSAEQYDFLDHIEMNNAAMQAIIDDSKSYGYAKEEGKVYGYWKQNIGGQSLKNWTVLVSQPEFVAFQEIIKFTNRVLTFTIISCLVVVPIALAVSQRIVTPIMQVARAARAVGQGEFDQEIPVTSHDEVGILAEAFNSMQHNLKDAVEKLTEEEKKMTAIVNSLTEGLILVDSGNRVLHINPAAEYLLNVSADDIGKDFTQLIQNEALIRTLKENQLQISLNKPVTSDVTFNHNDEKLVLRVFASPFLDESGSALGTVYVFDDITREKEIDQMKSDFISLVSHELRTPLTSIIGFVSFILDGRAGQINEKQQNSLARVQRQSKRLAALINNLLDISRIESGRIQMREEPISPLEIATQRLEEIRPQADEKSIQLNLIAPDSLPRIIGDEERIGQVFTNLIGNAIKFTPNNGQVVLKLTVDGALLHVEVIDTGPGIPVEERQNVFDKFYQMSDIHTRQQGGSGLGLSITKNIIEAHGGTLWIDDGDRGKGSNFQFVLPLAIKNRDAI